MLWNGSAFWREAHANLVRGTVAFLGFSVFRKMGHMTISGSRPKWFLNVGRITNLWQLLEAEALQSES